MRCLCTVLSLGILLGAARADLYNLAEGDDPTSLLQRGAEALHSRQVRQVVLIAGDPPQSLPAQLGHMRPALWAVSCVTVLYFAAYAVLAIIHAFNQAQDAGPGPVEKALESAVMGVCFAPMLCVLFLSVYKRADTLGAGEPYTYGLPPDYVRIAMAVAVMAFAAQMVSYTGREWAIHKQAGRPIRRVPSFWNNIFNVAMLCMYLAVTVVIAGLIQMQQPSQLQDLYGSLPLSSGIFCSNSLLVLYFAVYAGLQIAKTMDVDFRERGTYPESLTDPSRYIIEVLKMTASEVQVAPMLAVFCVGVQLTVDARREELPSTVETSMYICCLSLFVQAAVATATPFITRAELKVVPGTVDIVDFATGHPRLYVFMSSLRWVSTAALYLGICVICAHLWRQTDEPVWVILVMHLGTYFFIVHFCLFLCVSIRQLSNVSMMDGIRTLTTAKDTVSICPMLSVLFIECWVAANDIRTPVGLPGVPQGFAQDYMFVATWAMLMQLVVCFVNGFVYTLPKDSKVMRLCGNSLRGGLTAISIVFYLTLVTVYASILVVLVSRYTNTARAATGGVDWSQTMVPLGEVSGLAATTLCLYIIITVFAVINVVTGVFCNTAIESAAADKDIAIMKQMKQQAAQVESLRGFFEKIQTVEGNVGNQVSLRDLKEALHRDKLSGFLESMGISTQDVWSLFMIIDADRSGLIDLEEFVAGCMQLHGPAKSLHVAKMNHDNKVTRQMLQEVEVAVRQAHAKLDRLLRKPQESFSM